MSLRINELRLLMLVFIATCCLPCIAVAQQRISDPAIVDLEDDDITDPAKIRILTADIHASVPGTTRDIGLDVVQSSVNSIIVTAASHGLVPGDLNKPLAGYAVYDDTNGSQCPNWILSQIINSNTLKLVPPGGTIVLDNADIGSGSNVAGAKLYWDDSASLYQLSKPSDSAEIAPAVAVVVENDGSNTTVTVIPNGSPTPVSFSEITIKENGIRTGGISIPAGSTNAQRGAIFEGALDDATSGQTFEYLGTETFEVDDYLLTGKDNITVDMPNATLLKPDDSESDYILRVHECNNCTFRFGVANINASVTPIASRDTAFQLGGGYNNKLILKEIVDMRRPWEPWSAVTAYDVGDGVYYGIYNTSGANMQWYHCIQANTNQPPTEGGNAYWTEKYNSSIEMDVWYRWDETESYSINDIVWYGQAYWKATGSPVVGTAPGEAVANWALAGEEAPNGWTIEVARMHNPGQKGIRLGGDNTTLRNTHISQDPAEEMNIPQTHTAFDYWRSGGRLNINDVYLQDITAEAGTYSEILYDMQVNGLTSVFTTTRGTNTTAMKFQCQGFFKGKNMYFINPVNNNRANFKITVESLKAYISDSSFSGYIGCNGDTEYVRCKFGHEDNTLSDMFYQLEATRYLTLRDCDMYAATDGIEIGGPDEDVYVTLDNVRCHGVTNLFRDARRTDRIIGRNVTGYSNFCVGLKNWDVQMNCEGLNRYELYGSAVPTGGYSLKGTKVWNTGAGATEYWICTTSGYNVISAMPAPGASVVKGSSYSDGADIKICTTAGTVGGTAVFRTYAGETASVWAAH